MTTTKEVKTALESIGAESIRERLDQLDAFERDFNQNSWLVLVEDRGITYNGIPVVADHQLKIQMQFWLTTEPGGGQFVVPVSMLAWWHTIVGNQDVQLEFHHYVKGLYSADPTMATAALSLPKINVLDGVAVPKRLLYLSYYNGAAWYSMGSDKYWDNLGSPAYWPCGAKYYWRQVVKSYINALNQYKIITLSDHRVIEKLLPETVPRNTGGPGTYSDPPSGSVSALCTRTEALRMLKKKTATADYFTDEIIAHSADKREESVTEKIEERTREEESIRTAFAKEVDDLIFPSTFRYNKGFHMEFFAELSWQIPDNFKAHLELTNKFNEGMDFRPVFVLEPINPEARQEQLSVITSVTSFFNIPAYSRLFQLPKTLYVPEAAFGQEKTVGLMPWPTANQLMHRYEQVVSHMTVATRYSGATYLIAMMGIDGQQHINIAYDSIVHVLLLPKYPPRGETAKRIAATIEYFRDALEPSPSYGLTRARQYGAKYSDYVRNLGFKGIEIQIVK